MQDALRSSLEQSDSIDSQAFARTSGTDHEKVVGVFKSLGSAGIVNLEQVTRNVVRITPEGRRFLDKGASPEFELWGLLGGEAGCSGKAAGEKMGKDDLQIARGKLAALKLIEMVKEADDVVLKRKPGAVFDSDQALELLRRIDAGEVLQEKAIDDLRKRKLIAPGTETYFIATRGPAFSQERKKEATELTYEMLANWKEYSFKPYKFVPETLEVAGNIHPLIKIRFEARDIFLQMGFQEMSTHQWVESSFWNFDTLFVPQNHPAREMQDTFFIKSPSHALGGVPQDYLDDVKAVHTTGKYGSLGYNVKFSDAETMKNVLRTHTTACSSRTLKRLAATGFKPGKYFSIDRVFRNEEMDKTHLCEFNQIEGFIIGEDLSLTHLMTVLRQFFQRMGVEKLMFKPTFNPYTEPSLEVHGYHSGLGKMIEVGNSGLFRPEMLRPMGFNENVSVIAWGLSLERPAMIKYNLKSIHDLFGQNVDLSFIQRNPIARY